MMEFALGTFRLLFFVAAVILPPFIALIGAGLASSMYSDSKEFRRLPRFKWLAYGGIPLMILSSVLAIGLAVGSFYAAARTQERASIWVLFAFSAFVNVISVHVVLTDLVKKAQWLVVVPNVAVCAVVVILPFTSFVWWIRASSIDSNQGYQEFIGEFPSSSYASRATSRISQLRDNRGFLKLLEESLLRDGKKPDKPDILAKLVPSLANCTILTVDVRDANGMGGNPSAGGGDVFWWAARSAEGSLRDLFGELAQLLHVEIRFAKPSPESPESALPTIICHFKLRSNGTYQHSIGGESPGVAIGTKLELNLPGKTAPQWSSAEIEVTPGSSYSGESDMGRDVARRSTAEIRQVIGLDRLRAAVHDVTERKTSR